MKKVLVISLGGSVISPKLGKVDILFLKKFRQLVLGFASRKKHQVIIVTGGGKLNQEYNRAVKKVMKPLPVDLDYLGIAATKFHAEFIRVLFGKWAFPKLLENPTRRVNTAKPVICATGWKPGCSSDKDAIMLAQTFKSRQVINLTNIDYVYTKNPNKHKDAKKVKSANWQDYRKMIPRRWSPRLSTPFDPVASRLAQKLDLTVLILNGRKISEFKKVLDGRPFRGTILHP